MKKHLLFLAITLCCLLAFSFIGSATEEITTQPCEETTTLPTQQETTSPEIVLPQAPTGLHPDKNNGYGKCDLFWDYNENANGYNVYIKQDGKWVFFATANNPVITVTGLLAYSEYEFGVKSFITVDGVNYESKEMASCTYLSQEVLPTVYLYNSHADGNGLTIYWDPSAYVTGYVVYIRENGKWVKLETIKDNTADHYTYSDIEAGKSYTLAVRTYVKSSRGTKYSKLFSATYKLSNLCQPKLSVKSTTKDSVTLKWNKIEGVKGYRVYMYKNDKLTAIKTLGKNTYTVTGLEASTRYKFRVRAYNKINGETRWYAYSNILTAATKEKTVKAYRVKALAKLFKDNTWSVHIKNMLDSYGDKFDYIIAAKGKNLYERYTYKKGGRLDYLYLSAKNKTYAISPGDKEYLIFPKAEGKAMLTLMQASAETVKVHNVGKVKASTCLYGGKTAIKETYTDTVYGFEKTYYFVNEKLTAFKVKDIYGNEALYTGVKIYDTPGASLFKLPSGYKQVSY